MRCIFNYVYAMFCSDFLYKSMCCGYLQQNFCGSNPDGSFTMDESNTFLSPQGFPPNTIYG